MGNAGLAIPGAPATPQPPIRAGRGWYIDDIVVITFALLGLGGGILLPLKYGFYRIPSIDVAAMLATGIAALTYRYLGGTQGNSFTVGAFKTVGSVAVFVGVAWFINSYLDKQINREQVWRIKGTVLDETKNPIDPLNDADFQLTPGAGHADRLGDFHAEFIRDPNQPDTQLYLTITHKGFGPVVVPLDAVKLRAVYHDAQVQDKLIEIDHIVLPKSDAPATPPAQNPQGQQLQPSQLSTYNAAAQSAKPADPAIGGVPQ